MRATGDPSDRLRLTKIGLVTLIVLLAAAIAMATLFGGGEDSTERQGAVSASAVTTAPDQPQTVSPEGEPDAQPFRSLRQRSIE